MKQQKKLSITDVARATGVSVTTVSLVLNGKAEGRIGPPTIRKVKDYAKKVGYKPHPIARPNRQKNKVFGILLEHIAAPQQSRLAAEVENILRNQGYHSVIVSMNGDATRGEELLRLLQDREIDGYVVMSFEDMERSLKKLRTNHVPVVLYDGYLEGVEVRSVTMDYASKLKETIGNYLDIHKDARVGLVTCPSNAYRMRTFLDGYMSAMDRYAGDVMIKKTQTSVEDREVKEQIIDFVRDNKLDAVLFSTDRLARIGVEAIENERLPVQCVIATDVSALSGESTVSYISLKQDIVLIAEKIVEGLLS